VWASGSCREEMNEGPPVGGLPNTPGGPSGASPHDRIYPLARRCKHAFCPGFARNACGGWQRAAQPSLESFRGSGRGHARLAASPGSPSITFHGWLADTGATRLPWGLELEGSR